MKSDLDLLIKTLTAEKKVLEKAIKQSLKEYDYLIAHYHSQALFDLNYKLRILNSFKDPLHDKKDLLERRTRFFQRKPAGIKKETWLRLIAHRQEDIERDKAKLEILKQQNFGNYFVDSQVIDDAVFNIIGRVYKSFAISIDKDGYYELILKFENIDGQLLISTKHDVKFHEPDFIIDNRISTHLTGLGFKFDNEREEYLYKFDLTNFKEATPVKILLSRIIFDLYKPNDINQNCTLVYYN